MCVKSRNNMTVPILHNGTDLKTLLQNAQLPHSSNMKTVGVQTVQTAICFLPTHFPSSPMRRIDLLSWAAMVLPANQQGHPIRATSRAKMGVKDSQGIAFCAVSLAIGHRNVHPVADYSHCLYRFVHSKNRSKKTERWAVCRCM